MNAAAPAMGRLVRRLDVSEYGGDTILPWLPSHDGSPTLEDWRFVVLQSPGQFQSRLYAARDDLDEVDQQLGCLTCVDGAGTVLWQRGEPYPRAMPYTSHGADSTVLMDDIDADGDLEIVWVRGQELLILAAESGAVKAGTSLPADNLTNLSTAQLGPPTAGKHIIVKVNDRSYEPWDYANPTMVFAPDLSVYRDPFAVRGAGHNVVAMDVNGDGRDELLIGYSLLDANCDEIWRLDLGEDFDYVHDHADEIAVSRAAEDGQYRIRYAGSEDLFIGDLNGNLLWKTHAGHSQTTVRLHDQSTGKPVLIMNEKNLGIWGLDENGTVLWHRTDINGYAWSAIRWPTSDSMKEWALFRPQLRPISPTPYTSDPAWYRDLWPGLLDGTGSLHPFLPWLESYARPAEHIRASRSYDCGVRYATKVLDLDHDGRDEVVVFNRSSIWVFHSEDP